MLRKWTTLALALFAVMALETGYTFATDESPLEKLMESVGKENNAIKKATRTKPAFAKADKKEIVKNAEELIKLGKESRDIKSAAEKQKKPLADWQKAVDDFVKKTEEFKSVMEKPGTTFEQAKKSFTALGASCSSCHKDFKGEDE